MPKPVATDGGAAPDRHLRATIERALRGVAARHLPVEDQAAAIAAAVLSARLDRELTTTPAEKVAEQSRRLLDRYDALGGDSSHSAAGALAMTLAAGDPHRRMTIERRIRRLAQKRRERAR